MSDPTQPPHAPRPEPASLHTTTTNDLVEMSHLPPAAIARTASSSTPPPNTSTDPSSSRPLSEAITPARLPPTLSESLEAPTAADSSTAATAEPAITITLLLPSGKRYPYTLNTKYLRKRKEVVTVQDDDPSKITVYFMKLLLMHDWKEDWADKPQTADKIRLIYFGRMLEDSSTLKDCKLDGTAGPNVVHMSIRPPDTIEEDADPKHASRAAEEEGSRGCCGGCMVI
ncbi:ubiquitin-related domain-containing protein [Venturia nashicola]|uniref:Ubiquitin-related domain-containing protein n=1 Tax=Venturia nashicola TaxID=86259 RepID=A0A4Z1P1Q7_9PEZI|nr:ubiquitin-related domain-containing protein [Venturia nashicola]TLD34464.1 ubiquitin-related domain-containing protein [Venturia nashicola]